MEKKIIDLTKKLVKFRSTEKNAGELKKIIDFVGKYFSGPQFKVRKFSRGGKHSIVVTFEDTKSPEIFLNGHLDVVEAEPKDFSVMVKGGRMYGRGTGDMKGEAAVLMEIMKYFGSQKERPSLGLMLTTDEEIGGENGVEYLLKDKGYRSKLVIIPDGGHYFHNLVIAEKGLLHMKMTAEGKASHGSYTWEGTNAIDILIDAYGKIRKIFPKVTAADNWKRTCNLGIMKGGDTVNKVPDRAEMCLDIRYTKKGEGKKLLAAIKKVNPKLKVEVLHMRDVLNTPASNPYLQKYLGVCRKVIGKKAEFGYEHGASDASFFAEYDIPVMIHEPHCENLHGKNEYVDIKDLVDYYGILREFLSLYTRK